MLLKKIFIVLAVSLFSYTSCKNPESTSAAVVPDVPMDVPEGFSPDGIDQETISLLTSKADHIDYIFNSIPLSMNQDGQKAIFQELAYISRQSMPGVPTNCTPLARKIYLGDGDILLESDIYFSEGCLFQIFIKDERPLFGNLLSQGGIAFYKNLMLEAKQSMPEDVRQRYTIPSGI